nr:hydroxymyristoyl-ACP dehydratase [Prevotella sp.]
MKLLNSLYKIQRKEVNDNGVIYNIHLDKNHFIYQAHFPGQPITPGVCIIQIAQELLEDFLGMMLDIKSVKNVKFLSVISPEISPEVSYELTKITTDSKTGETKMQVIVSNDNVNLAKVSLSCKRKQ